MSSSANVTVLFPAHGGHAASLSSRLLRPLAVWARRRAATRYLQGLDEHMLRDIGIRRSEITAVVRGGQF